MQNRDADKVDWSQFPYDEEDRQSGSWLGIVLLMGVVTSGSLFAYFLRFFG